MKYWKKNVKSQKNSERMVIEGNFTRSRAKWITEGEKSSNYFCNLEKRNFVSNAMNKLCIKDGELLTDQSKIIDETVKHYKTPYTKHETNDVNLRTTLTMDTIPKLSDTEKESLEWELGYQDNYA